MLNGAQLHYVITDDLEELFHVDVGTHIAFNDHSVIRNGLNSWTVVYSDWKDIQYIFNNKPIGDWDE